MGSGAGARAERTSNIELIAVTLDVLKLSGWLNAFACCQKVCGHIPCRKRSRKGGMRCGGEVWPGRREAAQATAAQAACRGELDCRLGAGHGEDPRGLPS